MKITGKITDFNGLPLGKTTIKKITGKNNINNILINNR